MFVVIEMNDAHVNEFGVGRYSGEFQPTPRKSALLLMINQIDNQHEAKVSCLRNIKRVSYPTKIDGVLGVAK